MKDPYQLLILAIFHNLIETLNNPLRIVSNSSTFSPQRKIKATKRYYLNVIKFCEEDNLLFDGYEILIEGVDGVRLRNKIKSIAQQKLLELT